MTVDSAHTSNWQIGEVVFGIPFLLGIGVQFVFPLSLPQGILKLISLFAGIALIIIGAGILVLARRELTRFHQPTDPGHPTNKIVTTGVFSVSRNPLYLSAAVLLFGIGLALNNLWILITLLLSIIICHYVLIIPEEKYLAAKFGEEYKEYTNTVRRWFSRK